MLGSFNRAVPGRRLTAFSASVVLHVLLLACLLYRPGPRILSPSSVMAGQDGSSLTHLYWPSQPVTASVPHPKQHKPHARLAVHRPPKLTLPVPAPIPTEDETAQANPPAASTPPPAGSSYGSAEDGSATGEEIRPALPVSTTDPVVGPNDLKGGIEGNEIVEITIDEKGNIVQKVVVQSLGPAVDAKVLAALENWHFRPATRNGVAIPSKQDVFYHFPRRG
jgi:periplasmic protein TonB